MNCKRICLEYEVKTKPKKTGRYGSGQKRCSFCNVFMVFDGNRCPCCKCILRKKPRIAETRSKIVEKQLKEN